MLALKNSTKSTMTRRGKTIMLALTAIFTGLVIAGAFITIPIPVIPFTLQTFFVQLTATMLGPLWGGIAIALYLFIGLIGIPVFTKGGGFMYVLQPTFGYLIGFLIGAIAGGLILKLFKKKSYWAYLTADIATLLIAYIFGMLYFYLIKSFYFGDNVTAYTIFIYCFLIFLPGDLTFTFIAAIVAKKLNPILGKLIYQTATDADIEKFNKENAEQIKTTQNDTDIQIQQFEEQNISIYSENSETQNND